ncbi:MAG TPA: CoA transferase [Candidatus Tectomicrobia bacterium]|jgi:benzylsuccinate CoA-transferase BbsF subunit
MPAALQGYRVLDFGTAWAGSIPGHILADFGAEVIKIESYQRVDLLRYGPGPRTPMRGKPWDEARECNPWFHAVNRGKLGITLNFTTARGAALVRELVRQSDIVVDNFTPGVLQKYNLHYDALTAVKPDLIMLSVSVAGQQGPYQDTRAYAFNLHALSGLCSLIGYVGDPMPRHVDIAYADWNAGMFGTYAILLALYHRRRTGAGQFIDLSAWEATTTLLTEGILDYTLNRRVPGPQDNQHPRMAPHGYYPCQGDDVWLALAIRSEHEWQTLCNLMGHSELTTDTRFCDMYQRLTHRQELDAQVAAWTQGQEVESLARRLQQAGIAAMPLRTVEGRFHDAHLQARQTHIEFNHPGVGKELLHTIPWRLSETPPRIQRHAPRVGEHNADVLGELLGLSTEEQQKLAEEGVL